MNANENRLKYIFAAYLNEALKREKRDYLNKKARTEIPMISEWFEEQSEIRVEQELDKIRSFRIMADSGERGLIDFVEEIGNRHVSNALLHLKKQEMEILFLRIYKELSYKEIGKKLGMSSTKAASAYHYACKKMRKEIEKECHSKKL